MIGRRLRALRLEKGVTIRALARKVGVDFSYISQIEHQKRQPSRDLVTRFAVALGVDADELLVTAGYLPEDVGEILGRDPELSLRYIREKLAKHKIKGGKNVDNPAEKPRARRRA